MSNIIPDLPPKARKFIPDGDAAFADMAERFAQAIARNPKRYNLTNEDGESLCREVKRFREAFTKASTPEQRTHPTIAAKDNARHMAERLVRKYGTVLRADPNVPSIDKELIGVYEKPAILGKRKIPKRAPVLTYHGPGVEAPLGPGVENNATGTRSLIWGTHILKFHTDLGTGTRAKPTGVTRVEVFVDLVPPSTKIPTHPAERTGRAWYLRSFTTSRMEVEFPMPAQPMLVVYWARWASATGEVGRFSRTCIARQEGWTSNPAALIERKQLAGRAAQCDEARIVFLHTPYLLTAELEDDEQCQELAEMVRNERRALEAA